MKKLFSVAVVVCLGIVACTVPPKPRIIVNSWVIEKPFDSVWTSVIESFAELNLPILNMEKASGLITTDWMLIDKKYMDCGTIGLDKVSAMPAGKDYKCRFNVMVKKVSDTSAEMKVNGIYRLDVRENYGNGTTFQCVSTGALEAEIYTRVSERIK
jgi:hypothetical protein